MDELKFEDLYEDDGLLIQHNKPVSLIQLVFKKTPDTAHFRNGYSIAIDAAAMRNVHYWLTDAQQIKTMLPENQVWLKQQMAPLLKNQLKKFAIVMAPECFVMTSPNQVYEQPNTQQQEVPTGILKVHFDKQAAYNWMLDNG